MPEAAYLHCPLRGTLPVRQRAKDGLTFTEEKARIDALRFLLQRGYPRAHFDIEPTVLRFGHKGRNSLRPVRDIGRQPHFKLGDIVDLVPEKRVRIEPSQLYRYVEIQNIGLGPYDYEELRGWQLPSRAKLAAHPGDIFVAAVWASVGKWCIVGEDCKNLLVTNGCIQLRLRDNCEDRLIDLVAGLCSEAFRVQMRAISTGSDGLAEIVPSTMLDIRLPLINDLSARERLAGVVDAFRKLDARLDKAVLSVLKDIKRWPNPPDRKSHCALV